MRENELYAKPRHGAPQGPRAHDGTIITDTLDEMWGTDMNATLLSTGQQVAVFVAVDHCSANCVGIIAAIRGALRGASADPSRCAGMLWGHREGCGRRPDRSHDNGSQYISHDFQSEIAWLGAKSSPSFVRTPEGNGCAERFIRTLKEKLLWVRTFDTVEGLQAALQKFKYDYNEQWLIQRYGHRSPNQFRHDAMDKIPTAT